eukprot:5964388-Amphidinium_carterae.1
MVPITRTWYATAGVRSDMLKLLPLKRFRAQAGRPCLKAGAAQVRTLVPFFLQFCTSWLTGNQEPYSSAELALVHKAAIALT